MLCCLFGCGFFFFFKEFTFQKLCIVLTKELLQNAENQECTDLELDKISKQICSKFGHYTCSVEKLTCTKYIEQESWNRQLVIIQQQTKCILNYSEPSKKKQMEHVQQ